MTEVSDDDDDISLTSTVPSPPKENYYVDTIHAERETSQGIEYLVGWEDYPIERSSWETAAQFDDEQTLLDWEDKKREIAAGRLEEFDLTEFNRRLHEAEQACQKRKHKRHLKREKLAKSQLGPSNTRLFSSTSNGPRFTDSDVTLNPGTGTASVYSSRVTNQSQVGPSRSQSIRGGLTRPPLVGFGTGRGGRIRSRPRRSYDAGPSAPPKMFKLLSTKHRYEKARGYEPAPNVDQLELMRPSEWSSTAAATYSFIPGSQQNTNIKGQEPGESPRRTISDVLNTDTFVSQPQTSRSDDSKTSNNSSPVSDRPRRLSDRSRDLYLIPRRRPGPEAKWIKKEGGSYFVNPGELLCTLYYGPDKKEIGEVRMCGLDKIRRSRFLRTKRFHVLEIWFQHLCNLPDYNLLCRNTANEKYWNGWVEGFEDSEPEIYRFGKELSRRNLVAICIPEIQGHDVLLAYPPNSEDFGFLDGDFRGPRDIFLHTAVRSALGPIERLAFGSLQGRGHLTEKTTGTVNYSQNNTAFADKQAPEAQRELVFLNQESDPSIIEAPTARIGLESRPHTNTATSLMNRCASSDSIQSLQRSSGIDHMDIDQDSKDPTAAVNSDQRQPQLGMQLPFDLDYEFEKRFGVTFQTLATVAEKRLAGSFYVLFPQGSGGIEEECQAVVEFLKAHHSEKNKAIVYSNRTPEDWEKFTQAKNGVILIHESFLDFYKLQGLGNLCRQSTFNFWSFILNKELADNRPYFQRMFQTGGVILITAEYMLSDPRGTVVVLSWFEDYAKSRYPGTWKLMLPPDILNWLQKQIEVTGNSSYLWLAMYHLIMQITFIGDAKSRDILTGAEAGYTPNTVISPPKLPGYGFRTNDEIPDIPKDRTLTQEQRNADHLVEFYAGWALINCYQFRKFLVLTASALPRWDEWHHLQIRVGSTAFIKYFDINYRWYWEKLKHSAARSNYHSERSSQTPFTPQTPKAGSSESAISRATPSYIPPLSHHYPQPYQ